MKTEKKTKEEILEYNKKLKEVFEKHGLIPVKKHDEVREGEWIVIFPGNKNEG